jgi:hypothetical protein
LDGTRREKVAVRVASFFLVAFVAWPAAAQEPSWEQNQSIPAWASEVLEGPEFTKDYALSTRLNPFLVQGDFTGDGRLDFAVLLSQRKTGARGIAVLHAGSTRPVVLGAGHALGNGGADFSWMNAWSVYPKGPVSRGADAGPPPDLRGDALLVQKLEASSAIIFWDGTSYRWYQQGD